ncbi:hypothetical protein AA700_0627 [Acidiphilium acidophilum DSM 700]|nr:hypothetical protein AA700_0627 [Acidiphilium acidophilum DSM 700]
MILWVVAELLSSENVRTAAWPKKMMPFGTRISSKNKIPLTRMDWQFSAIPADLKKPSLQDKSP